MPKKFRNKYRISSSRLPNWDYGSNGAYFITVCTKKRIKFFGSIVDGEMILSQIGRIVAGEWQKTPSIRPELNLLMDDFVIMPDHIHGIIIIRDAMHGVSVYIKKQNQFGPQRNNIPSIIRGLKSAITIQSRKINPQFGWQPGYHVRIVRNKTDYDRIAKYIKNNPGNYRG